MFIGKYTNKKEKNKAFPIFIIIIKLYIIMSKYLKLFEQDADYHAFKETEDYILPNVSYAIDTNIVYYNPYFEGNSNVLKVVYNSFNTSDSGMRYCSNGNNFKTMKIDGVEIELENLQNYYFNTVGTHVVEFTLIDETTMYDGTFSDCDGIVSVEIPDCVLNLGNGTFSGCDNLSSIKFGNSLKTIGNGALNGCPNLTSIVLPSTMERLDNAVFAGDSNLKEIVCHAVVAPAITSNTFSGLSPFGVLRFPSGSDYSTWMSDEMFYLGYMQWEEMVIDAKIFEIPNYEAEENASKTEELFNLIYANLGEENVKNNNFSYEHNVKISVKEATGYDYIKYYNNNGYEIVNAISEITVYENSMFIEINYLTRENMRAKFTSRCYFNDDGTQIYVTEQPPV
jgi:hypothetical protein